MAFIRPVCVRADTILAAVMIISYAFIKVLRKKKFDNDKAKRKSNSTSEQIKK